MATKPARIKAILTAVMDNEPTPAHIDRVVGGFALAYAPEMAATMTTAEKQTLFLRTVRAFVRETVYSIETRAAQEQARQTITPPDLGTD